MRKSAWLMLGAVIFAALEIWLIAVVGEAIGHGWTLFLLVAGVVLGGWLMRLQWSRALGALSGNDIDSDQIGARVTDSAMVFLGASLLVFPGFISDALGVLFLLPFTRAGIRWVVTAFLRWLTADVRAQMTILDARLRPETVVEAEDQTERQKPETQKRPGDDGEVISGEILP